MSRPEHSLSIDSAASWPVPTAQMMFFGPKAESPEEHLRMGRGHGLGIDLGHVPLVELDADVALDPGKAFSWPTATNTSSQGTCWTGSPVGTRLRRPLASYSAFTFSNSTPVRRPFSWVNFFGDGN